MAQGNLHPPIPMRPDGHDDVDELSESLLALAGALESKFRALEKLAQLTEHVNAGLLVIEVLDRLFESFWQVIPYDRIGCALLEDDGQTARSIWARSIAGAGLQIGEGYKAPLAGSSLQEILASGEPRILDDLCSYLREHPGSRSTEKMIAEGIRSNLTCPLVALGKPVGFLFFSSREPSTYRRAHVDFFMRVAGQIATVIEKGRLYQQLLESKAELERANAKLQRLASVDGLTGVANRRSFDACLAKALRVGRRERKPVSVLLVDVDFFKRVNDTHGHAVGDECLRAIATALEGSCKRGGDAVGRYGGEEFGVVLPATDEDGARTVAERARRRVEAIELTPERGGPVRVTVSIGLATVRTTEEADSDALLERADRALYSAKLSGRNRVVPAPTGARVSAMGLGPVLEQQAGSRVA